MHAIKPARDHPNTHKIYQQLSLINASAMKAPHFCLQVSLSCVNKPQALLITYVSINQSINQFQNINKFACKYIFYHTVYIQYI